MKKTIYITSYDDYFTYPNAHGTLESALSFNPKRIVKVSIDVPIDEAEAVEELIK